MQERGFETKAPKDAKYSEVEGSLVELDGMAGDRRAPVDGMAENNAPREIGGGAEHFLVDEVADADAEGGKGSGNGEEIEETERGELGLKVPNAGAEEDGGSTMPMAPP